MYKKDLKLYVAPEMEVEEADVETSLLAGSATLPDYEEED